MNKLLPIIGYMTLFVGSVFVGIFLSNSPEKVYSSMSGSISYLGIIASVSLAVLAMLGQLFDRKVSLSAYSHLRLHATYKSHVKIECFRIIMMVFPVIIYTVTSMMSLENNPISAGILAGSTCIALLLSLILPFKYASLMKDYIQSVFDNA